ncbi:SAM domain-containing protein [Caenorhabditis elegans]|uniref:SAM domain-containing protein n=1 Tax=Caenorhabditis elegans TaxID=6239 RepID=Q565C7_CAEEL|nr:SAM domain-containing protein [Caenorhabditis elegans]CAI79214.1 SAM domain-containing protein [Caenorhabditis elegans]|eukprot:NP_001024898.1 Uncharacterized protein CELE_T08D10.4 [Caenorhabditis elegans]
MAEFLNIELKNKLATILCRLQMGIQVEECLKFLCVEDVPLSFFEECEIRQKTLKLVSNPRLTIVASQLLSKMDQLKLKKQNVGLLNNTFSGVVLTSISSDLASNNVTEHFHDKSLKIEQMKNKTIRENDNSHNNQTQTSCSSADLLDNIHQDSSKLLNLSENTIGTCPNPDTSCDHKVYTNIPLVYKLSVWNYENCYYKEAKKRFGKRLNEKGDDETWTAFFRRLYLDQINAPKHYETRAQKSKLVTESKEVVELNDTESRHVGQKGNFPKIDQNICELVLPSSPTDEVSSSTDIHNPTINSHVS